MIAVVVPAEQHGERLDRAVALLTDVSRAEVARWIEAGRVRISGRIATKSAERVRSGQEIEADPLPPPPSDARPDASVAFAVVYQDDALIVVDKPAGLVVHPAKGHWDGTLVNGLLALGPLANAETGEQAARPGIVHRIDKDTSGVLVVARTPAAREALKQAFARHDIERVYDAIAVGVVNDTTFDTFHERHPTDRKRFTGKRSGKRAVTHVAVVERFEGATRVECRLETGRTHQIRMHLAEAGAPLLGDALYGKPPRELSLRTIGEELGRQALHARVLGFVHPVTGKTMRFEAKWPDDFAAAVSALRARRPLGAP